MTLIIALGLALSIVFAAGVIFLFLALIAKLTKEKGSIGFIIIGFALVIAIIIAAWPLG